MALQSEKSKVYENDREWRQLLEAQQARIDAEESSKPSNQK